MQRPHRLLEARKMGLVGMLGPSLGFGGIFLSVALSPWFNWLDNALSDLGHPLSPVFWIFNLSLTIAGLISLIFVSHLVREAIADRSVLGILGSLILFMSFALLIGVGIVNESIEPFHSRIALGFFLTLTFSSIIYGIHLIRVPNRKKVGVVALIAGLFNTIMLFGGFLFLVTLLSIPISGLAIPEIILAGVGELWIILLGLHVYCSA